MTANEKEELPQVGDVIVSPKFAYGFYYEKEDKTAHVDGRTTTRIVRNIFTEEERLQMTKETGNIPPKYRDEELGAYDSSRTAAKFVVEEARYTKGGNIHNNADSSFPSGWYVQARRLAEDDKYNPNGEIIEFVMRWDGIDTEDVQVVGKMKKHLFFE